MSLRNGSWDGYFDPDFLRYQEANLLFKGIRIRKENGGNFIMVRPPGHRDIYIYRGGLLQFCCVQCMLLLSARVLKLVSDW